MSHVGSIQGITRKMILLEHKQIPFLTTTQKTASKVLEHKITLLNFPPK